VSYIFFKPGSKLGLETDRYFLQEPVIFFDLSEAEKNEMEQ
jgi:hypothetical protein